jgi:hypothetical protein
MAKLTLKKYSRKTKGKKSIKRGPRDKHVKVYKGQGK